MTVNFADRINGTWMSSCLVCMMYVVWCIYWKANRTWNYYCIHYVNWHLHSLLTTNKMNIYNKYIFIILGRTSKLLAAGCNWLPVHGPEKQPFHCLSGDQRLQPVATFQSSWYGQYLTHGHIENLLWCVPQWATRMVFLSWGWVLLLFSSSLESWHPSMWANSSPTPGDGN